MAENHNRIFDVRILEMELRDGTLNDKEIQKFIKGLPDLDGQAEEVQIPLPGQRSAPAAGEGSKK